MNNASSHKLQPAPAGDRLAIVLSSLCLVHCSAMPFILALIPWLAWTQEHEPLIHRSLLLVIVPVSVTVLLKGCEKHSQRLALWLGITALAFLIAAGVSPNLPHRLEVALTALGSTALIASHVINIRTLKFCITKPPAHA